VATQTVGQIEALCSSLQQVGFETPQIVTPLEPFKEKDEL